MVATDDTYWILLIQIGISVTSWIQLVFSMNKFRGVWKFSLTDVWALLLFVHGGLVRWIASLAVLAASLEFQLATAFVGATLSWASFVVVFNDGFRVPSHQQWVALFMTLVLTALWEVNTRVLVSMPPLNEDADANATRR